MTDCCRPNSIPLPSEPHRCPRNGVKGQPVRLITLKSLLLPDALAQLNAHQRYHFCASPDCPVVYFGDDGQRFKTADLKVLVWAKDKRPEVPVCYCFGWQRHHLQNSANRHAPDEIAAHVKAGRCGCEMNNPQGRCCLGNVRSLLNQTPMENPT